MTAHLSSNELWRRYREDDSSARESLILNYAPLVKVLAGRLGTQLPAHVEQSDLIAFGLAGLLKAIELYDSERGVKFESYAQYRIRGAMLDGLRSMDWVPRHIRHNAREIELVESRLRAELGRSSSESELADGLGLTIAVLRKNLLDIANSHIYSFDAPSLTHHSDGSADLSLLDSIPSDSFDDPQEALDSAEGTSDLSEALTEAIAELPERQQFILSCRYQEDLRLGEIAEVIGVSESRVSQLHTQALISLRTAIRARKGAQKPEPAGSWS